MEWIYFLAVVFFPKIRMLYPGSSFIVFFVTTNSVWKNTIIFKKNNTSYFLKSILRGRESVYVH